MEFSVLGSLAVRVDDVEIPIGGAKRRALLCLLLLNANRVVPTDRLIDDLWEGEPPDTAASTLQSHVYNLRRALGPERLHTRAGGYLLDVGPHELDAVVFESELAAGRDALARGEPGVASDRLTAALTRWRGAAYEEVAGASWVLAEAARLEEAKAVALESLLEARLAQGAHAEVVGRAEAAVAAYPLRERLWAQLITALYRDGRQAEALRAYQRVRTLLAEELGIEPGTELRELELAVLAQDPSLAARPARPQPAPVAAPLPSGVVTFLLTDVVGSTRLWEAHPTEMAQALARHDAIVRGAVGTYGGVVLKARGEGDSTFSVFGRATDAVAAARAVQQGVAREAWPEGAALHLRMALHTGEAIEREGDYYGPAVNRVARLRGVAESGQILVSRSTTEVVVDHLPDDCHLVELGPLELQDLSRPESVYLLSTPVSHDAVREREPVAVVTRTPLPAGLAGAPFAGFHGRLSELELIEQRLKDVTDGGHRLMLVAGEPGIGKTALSGEVARVAFSSGATVAYGRCDEDVVVPYRPWVESIGHLVAHVDVAVLDSLGRRRLGDLARLVPALSDRIADVVPSSGGDPEADRYLLFGAVVALLQAASEGSPVVLVLDDLHWADRPTLSLLRHVVGLAEQLPLLIVATYRHSEVSAEHPLADALAALRRAPNVERLSLGGLDDDDLVAIVEAAAGQRLDGAELGLVHAVYRETDGNPFFAWELIRHLSESGVVSLSESGRWLMTGDLDESSLPDSVREVIGRRVARLGGAVKPVLAAAAVIGRDFDLELLALAMDDSPDAVLEVVEQAEAAQLVMSVAPGRFMFSHALVPHTLYQDLRPTRRAQLHRRVAEALEEIDAQGTRVTELARHWAEATAPAASERAVDAARRAGEQALRALAPDEAKRWFEQALTMLSSHAAADETARCELLLGLGDAQRQLGIAAHRETLLEAAHLAEQLGDADRLVRAALANRRGPAAFAGMVDLDRVKVHESALARIPPSDSAKRARLLAALSNELYFGGDFDRRRTLADEALAIAYRLDDPATLLEVMVAWCVATNVPETIDERRVRIAEAVALAETIDDPISRWWTIHLAAFTAFEAADPEEARRYVDVQVRLTEEIGQPTLRFMGAANRLSLAMLAGDFDEAERIVAERYALGQASGEPDALTLYGAELVWLRWHQGRLAELVDLLIETVRHTPDLPALNSALALALIEADRGDEVAVDVDEIDRLPYDAAWAVGTTVWAEVAIRVGAVGPARVLFDLLKGSPRYVTSTTSFGTGCVGHYLGALARVLGRFDEAEEYFRVAQEIHGRLGDPFYVARTNLEWGRMLLERSQPHDVERGSALIHRALAIARRYGCAGVEREATGLLGSPAVPQLSRAGAPTNLPADRSTFVGREQELGTIAEMLRSARVLTLTGVGGVGKTRLAIQAAASLTSDFPDGVWLVELAPLIDEGLVATAAVSAVGAPLSPGLDAADVVCRYLARRRALIVLDNCEHVIEAAATLVDALVSAAPGVRVLATSREPLGLVGEAAWRVPSLSVGADQRGSDASALFAERAAQVRPGFVLDESTTGAVSAICQRLDGIPLAIELAAARAKVMSVDQIAARLDERFRLLTRGGRTAVPRQQTLQGAMDWSYELLDPLERQFFDVLGVFAGTFDLAAAAWVAELDEFESLDLVQSLVDKSMLEVDLSGDRYRLLETLRQYAWDRLAATDRLGAVRGRHADRFMAMAGEQAARMGLAGQQVDALNRLEADYDNLRAALAHLIAENNGEAAVRLARRLVGLFNIRHPREGYAWFQQILGIAEDLPAKVRGRLLADTAYAAMTNGDGQAQVRLAQAAVDEAGADVPAIAHWLLSNWNLATGDYEEAIAGARRADAAALAQRDETTHVMALGQLLQALTLAGEQAEVRELAPEVMANAERLGNPTITASSRLAVSGALALLGSRADAIELLEQGFADAEAGGPIVENSTRSLYAFLLGDIQEAAAVLRPALATAKDGLAGALQVLPLLIAAKLLTAAGRHHVAAQLLGSYNQHGMVQPGNAYFHMASQSLSPWMHSGPSSVAAHVSYDAITDQLRTVMGANALEVELAKGAQLSPEEALQLAEEVVTELL